MRQLTVMRQTLADTIEAEGEDSILESICSRVAEGESPIDVSRSMGLSWFVVREWLEGGDKMSRLELAKRCYADGLVWEGLRVAKEASIETVALDKFQAEFFHKSAERMNPTGWGGKDDRTAGGITVVVQRGGVVAISDKQSLGSHLQGIAPEMETIEGEVL